MILAVCLIFVLYVIIVHCKPEGMVDRFGDKKHDMAAAVISNAELFSKDYNAVRNKFSWIDTIIYEDLRTLYMNDNLNYKNVLDRIL